MNAVQQKVSNTCVSLSCPAAQRVRCAPVVASTSYPTATASAWRARPRPLNALSLESSRREQLAIVRGIPVSGPSSSGEPSAMNASPAGQIAASLIASMSEKISKDLETDKVQIADAYG